MSISMYQASVPLLRHQLRSLIGILEKAKTHAEEKSIAPTVLTSSRLYPDMFPLTKQVQIATDIARRGIARLADVEAPPLEDKEITFPELIDRLQKTLDYLETFSADQIDGTEEKEITVPIGKGQTMVMKGWPFLAFFVMPNTYFHVTTAYDILRHNGVEVGKRDYLGSPD